MKDKLFLLFFISLSVLFGCSGQSNTNKRESEKQFTTAFPVADMNKSLQITVYSPNENYSSGSEISLIVENKSSHFILFDTNTYIKLLRNTGTQWVEIKNDMTYSGTVLLAPPNTSLLNFHYPYVKPVLDESNLQTTSLFIPVRIVIVGEIMDGEKPIGKKVGAFADISLKLEQPIIYLTDEAIQDGGKIEGIITSANDLNMPLPDVIVSLKYHPFYYQNNQAKVLVRTKTDSQGKYSFDNVEPGVYTLQMRIDINQGGPCEVLDLTKIINIKVGVVAVVNLGLLCNR